jgi:hypothetical protein
LVVGVVGVLTVISGCTGTTSARTPEFAPRDAAVTTAKPTRQDLSNRLSVTGKVTINPVFGLVAPATGEVRFLDIKSSTGTPARPTRVASVWANGKAHHVDVPAGARFAGRLADDRSTVQAGMPVVSAVHVGYGVVAELDSAQAYKVTGAPTEMKAQIKGGPGPFPCALLGTLAALPAGTLPLPAESPPAVPPQTPPAVPPQTPPAESPGAQPPRKQDPGPPVSRDTTESTSMRLVCTASADVTLINGASATIEIVTDKVANAIVLPVEAVAGSQGKGQVEVVKPDGAKELVAVVLGLTDGKVIEIKSGLTGDETVSNPGPNLPDPPKTKDGQPAGTETPR